ncbi:unnamed protein product [Macrosiphum euphorbiae]|uniref:Uncharacterized protein n=1 Tax=Macrosiphum euphorbiae TaxID=13131 RepID=A0AAV0XUR8_9HEMI|nr:unnamed protein product [Macrosiphum euphorbiae]
MDQIIINAVEVFKTPPTVTTNDTVQLKKNVDHANQSWIQRTMDKPHQQPTSRTQIRPQQSRQQINQQTSTINVTDSTKRAAHSNPCTNINTNHIVNNKNKIW